MSRAGTARVWIVGLVGILIGFLLASIFQGPDAGIGRVDDRAPPAAPSPPPGVSPDSVENSLSDAEPLDGGLASDDPAESSSADDSESSFLARVPWRVCTLTCRVIDEQGEVAVHRSFRVQAIYGDVIRSEYAYSDHEGVLRFQIFGAVPAESAGFLRIEPGTAPYRAIDRHQLFPSVVEVSLPEELPEGEHRLGDVVLEERPRIVSGVLLGPDGSPVRALVEVETHRFGDETVSLWHVFSDADGAFVIPTSPGNELDRLERASISIEARDCARIVGRPFAPGEELTVHLERGRTLRGSVRCRSSADLEIVVTTRDGSRLVVSRGTSDEKEERYEWWIAGVPLGPATISMENRATGMRFREAIDVREETVVPSLEEIDLR